MLTFYKNIEKYVSKVYKKQKFLKNSLNKTRLINSQIKESLKKKFNSSV